MKRIALISTIAAALTLGVTSCNLELRPVGTIDPSNALQSIEDAEHFRAGYYISLRGRVSSNVTYTGDLAGDLFHATTGFGQRGLTFYNWLMTTVDGDAEGIWSAMYSGVANLNYFITNANSCSKEDWTEDELATLQIYKGEAFFLRGFYHWMLVEKFCQVYVGNESTYGVPYMTVYNPTSDQTQYPDRGTLSETVALINQDLDSAEAYLTTPGAVASEILTADAVKALRARIALNTGDYQSAISYASALVNSGTYPLISDATEFNKIWGEDSGKEAIVQLQGSYPNNVPSGYGFNYVGYDPNNDIYSPDYVPEQWVIDLYEDGDIRFPAYFQFVTVTLPPGNAKSDLYIFTKFIGNPALKDPNTNGYSGANKLKPFRISEQYLILAEAYARTGNNGEAYNVLNTLRSARGASAVSGGDILEHIFDERVRELMGEGMYWNDIKRYHKDIQRGPAQVDAAVYMPSTYTVFHRGWGDHRYVWPIPQEEIDSNPNIANQQNPQY